MTEDRPIEGAAEAEAGNQTPLPTGGAHLAPAAPGADAPSSHEVVTASDDELQDTLSNMTDDTVSPADALDASAGDTAPLDMPRVPARAAHAADADKTGGLSEAAEAVAAEAVAAPADDEVTAPLPVDEVVRATQHADEATENEALAPGDADPQAPEPGPNDTQPLPVEQARAAAETALSPEDTGPLSPEQIAELAASTQPTVEGATLREPTIDVTKRVDSDVDCGSTTCLSWGARSDVGLVRGHNEDSFLVRCPLFCVCDGMGGHAAGEVASAIAVRTIAEQAPLHADDALLGAAVEAANEAVINGAATGAGKPGMGCTATCAYVEGSHMAVAHVGDSRIYLLRGGALVRVTHDHSYVEELVDAGEITADEARVHPSRSVITRALGSDPDMYADHFMLDVETGDRLVICSDGLSSMVTDTAIESICVTNATPQDCADALVAAALGEGGHDNVTVLVVDVTSDGRDEARRTARTRSVLGWFIALVAILVAATVAGVAVVNNSWYVADDGGYVGVYRGVHANVLGIPLSRLETETAVPVRDLPRATQKLLEEGITVASADEAKATVEAYRAQIDEQQSRAAATGASAQAQSDEGTVESSEAATTQPQDEAQAQTEADEDQGGE